MWSNPHQNLKKKDLLRLLPPCEKYGLPSPFFLRPKSVRIFFSHHLRASYGFRVKHARRKCIVCASIASGLLNNIYNSTVSHSWLHKRTLSNVRWAGFAGKLTRESLSDPNEVSYRKKKEKKRSSSPPFHWCRPDRSRTKAGSGVLRFANKQGRSICIWLYHARPNPDFFFPFEEFVLQCTHTQNQRPQIVLGKTLFIFSPSVCSPSRTFSIGDAICLGAYQYCTVLYHVWSMYCRACPYSTSAIRIWSIGGCLGRAEIHDRARAYSTVLYRFTNLNTVLFNFDS